MKDLFQQIANLTPEQRILFEKRLKQKGLKYSESQSIPKRQDSDHFSLSFAQQRLWFIQQLEPDNYSYNVPSAFRLRGELNIQVLERTLNEIVKRHETLRTTFAIDTAKQPVQIITPYESFSLPMLEVVETDIQSLVEREFQRPFDLTKPLLRLKLLKVSEIEHVLLITTHHIICDRWSVGVFVREMTILYASFAQNQASPLPELSIQYADWAVWQRQRLTDRELDKQINYWKQQLHDLSVLELPTDRTRRAIPSYQGAQYPIILSRDLSKQLKDLASQEQVTLFVLLLTAFQILLHRYTHQNDLVVGTEMANRDRTETNPLIGLFVNTLVLRMDLSGNPTFRELLKRVRETTLSAFTHQDLPFEKLVEILNPERNLSQMVPLFQVKFDFQQVLVKPLELSGLSLEHLPFNNDSAKYELRFNLQDTPTGINGQIEYSTDLFDEVTIQAMVEHWEILLAGIVQQPEQKISELPLLSPREQGLFIEWNQTEKNYPTTDLCIHHLFEAQVKRTPEAIALITEEQTLTYQELNTKANQLAHYLKELGFKPEAKIGICLERNCNLIIGLLGILKAGAAYVPLDPAYPQERLDFILEDAQVSALLVDELKVINLNQSKSISAESDNLDSQINPSNLAYIIYTSGSTGKPKGVAIEHRNTVQFLHWAKEVFNPDELKGVLAGTSICFDLSIFEIFVPLSWGGTVILVENVLALPNVTNQVTLINTVPSAIYQLLQTNSIPPSVRTINLAGEALQPYLVQQLQHIDKIYNLYGPSEDTTYSTYDLVNPDSVTIGKAIANTQVYILDPHHHLVPLGVPGELYISGSGLARGYLNRPDLTAEKFIPHFSEGVRLYKTGDLAKYRRDGKIEYLGRLDHQVKIRGFRVELGEIEAVLALHPGIQETVVTVGEDNQFLIAYVVCKEQVNTSQLRSFLTEKLPSYLIPSIFVQLEKLPRLPNGKINRKNLPNPNDLRPNLETTYVEPKTELEKAIAQIWQRALNRETIGIYDNFFELGGHSLLGMQVIAEVSEALGISVPLRSLFQKPTVAGLIEKINNTESAQLEYLPQIIPNKEEHHQPFPLTDIQQAYLIGRSDAFALGNVATHAYREIETRGISVAQVEQAIAKLITRHDMLRVIITEDSQQQILSDVPPYEILTLDLRGQNPAVTLAEIRERLSHQILNTQQWPLFEIVATILDEDRIRFHISFDVLLGDAWSFQILGAQLAQLIQNPTLILPELTLSFRDYVLAELTLEKTELYQASLAYWRNRLPSLPASPELPLEKSLAAITNPRFVRRSGQLESQTWQRLKQKASSIGITPSGLILAAFAEILTMWSQKPNFTINLTLFNRLPLHPEVNQIIGDFTSSTLFAVDNSIPSSFAIRAKTIQAQLWEDLDHRYVSGVKVLRELSRLQGGTILMPVVFTSTLTQNISGQSSLSTEVIYSLSQTSQVYLDHQVLEIEGTLMFNWDTLEELFPVGLLDDMFAAYSNFLERLANEEEIWETSTRLLIPASHLEKITEINRTEYDFTEKDSLLQDLFFAQVPVRGNKSAIVTSDFTLTYQELSDRSLTIAHQLQALRVQPNQLVAIVMEKGWEQIVATLSILASGAAYVPIDPGLPTERRFLLLQETQVQQILTQSWLHTSLTWPENLQIICVDKINPHPISELPSQTTPQDLAYIIYTSGSTGTPKGVMIDHQGAVNTILDINQRFNITAEDKVLALSSLSFDLSVYDIFGTLAAGGTLVIPDADKTKEPNHWRELITQYGVTIWNSVPALMQMLLSQPFSSQSLRLALLSGDWIPLDLPEQIRTISEDIEIISLGGATEASIWSILYPVTTVNPHWKSIPYGRPMTNQNFYVLNNNLEPCPMLVTGQLYIGGKGLASAYWKNPEKTNQSFIIHPQNQERLYKTGDLGRYLPDGNIEFLGREDFQVKVSGYRIELGEIETTLKQHSALKDAIALVVDNQRIIAYIIPEQKLENIEFKLKQPGIRILDNQPKIQLNKPDVDETLTQTYLRRQSHRQFLPESIQINNFSQLLNCLLQLNLPKYPLPKYRYASAGSLYPVQVYLLIKSEKIEGLAAGYYYYHPLEHQLILLDTYTEINSSLYGNNQAVFEESAFALFLVGELKAITPMYNDKAKDFCLLEAGYMSQLLMETAPAQEIGLCPIGTLEFDSLRDKLQLESSQILLHSFVGGKIDISWSNQWLKPQKSTSINEELTQFLRQKLPEYMIPTVYMLIDALPLNENGKVDRKLLPKPISIANQTEFIAPRTDIEKTISAIWQTSLNVEEIGIYDNFFDLGGNSFLATQVLAKICQTFQVDLTVRKFFENPTIASLALVIEEENPQKYQEINKVNDDLNLLSEAEVDLLLEAMLKEETDGE
ncbi:non-ribosomal peptide synthetase [Gloeocapsa sp. PCC 73106]|uniref:non-ribosomal peptide synthetase n=1 Tax=Gloeocapsa sp. PCC 73106 TaxID=102232 RepID=UPI0002AC24CF|nr:non-ribosomal peptide synthetase [Gloeocapsa sp. PCC 73106]ELR97624.1 amino acid adenylation enzyme/thioester reductase family protein [Gloeocapsa sp. PCC 73106]